MISKGQIKLIGSLEQKKNRAMNGLFVVEGKKGIDEILASPVELEMLFTTRDIFEAPLDKTQLITESELKKISCLKTPQIAVALFKIPENADPDLSGLTVALDSVRDPGNLGTIIRLCDWFGIRTLVCSNDTVDCYNPKVVQATMGSITRVNIIYDDLPEFLKTVQQPVFGAFLEGQDVYTSELPEKGILIMGNEANGISKEVEKLISNKISIPRFGVLASAESLNVATATAVLLSEFRRKSAY